MEIANPHRLGSWISAALILGIAMSTAAADEAAPQATNAIAEIEAANTAAHVAAVVELFADDNADSAAGRMPTGTRVARAAWIDGLCHIDLTFPAGTPAEFLGDGQADDLAAALAQAAISEPEQRGVSIRARVGDGGDYRPFDAFRITSGPATYPPLREDARAAMSAPSVAGGGASDAERSGPVGNAGHQPTGALSGVVVYATAGHGWTAGSSSWFLQRGLLFDMIEDYGNLDQLNYFAHYAFNAGATVVPLRPIGYQTIEVVLDQDDPGVTYTGAWTNSSSTPHYENGTTPSGVNYRFSSTNATQTATARYTPNLPSAGSYPVYTWALDSNNRTTQLYRIVHSGGSTEVRVDHRMVGKGWVWLGSYYFAAGTGGYVEISNQSAVAGNVIADGIRFGNGVGDVIGAGPVTVSGYPRDEECQRYWAESETAVNADGMSSTIYDCCALDSDDNVGAGARWAREMNNPSVNADRWRRIYLEFHSNAAGCAGGPPCTAKGTVALVDTGTPTTNQASYATILGDEIETDMQILDGSEFEFSWGSRTNPFNGSFGAIRTGNNGNEFDATILEVAFHDNVEDAAMLLDPKVRNAVARSSVHGVVKFLNSLAGSTVPLAFLPTEPRNVQAVHDGSGGVVLAWDAPVSGEAYGGAATGYRVYRSTNGYGFDAGADVGNVLTTTLLDVPAETTTYFRVAAYNPGGESMPSVTVAVRRSSSGPSDYLIVNGFDRVHRAQDPRQTLPGVGTQRRPLLHRVNSFDYVVQHATALADAGVHFDSCQNENVTGADVALGDYGAVVWILGEESTADETFSVSEQALVTTYLNAGGNLFASGSEIAWDLDAQAGGVAFCNNQLKADFVSDDAGTYNVGVVGGSIFDGIGAITFDNGALYYDVEFPDQLAANGGSSVALTYVGGAGGNAAVVFDGAFKVVTFGFPFETITSAARRSELMDAIVTFFGILPPSITDLVDCLSGPGGGYIAPECADVDFDTDIDVDLVDFQLLLLMP